MNQTNFEHVVEALGIMALIYAASYFLGEPNLIGGAIGGAFFFLGRENCQAEYRWISTFGEGKRANLPWWGAFDFKVWGHVDSWLDWIAPGVAVVVVTYLARW